MRHRRRAECLSILGEFSVGLCHQYALHQLDFFATISRLEMIATLTATATAIGRQIVRLKCSDIMGYYLIV